MPIGLVNDDEFNQELDRISSIRPETPKPEFDPKVLEGIILPPPSRGRKEGDNNVPTSLRAVIAEEHLMNGRSSALNLASEFGVSPSSVSAYAAGSTSTASYDKPKESIISVVNKARERATKRAAKTLNAALGAITQEKLDYTDADKLSGIAKDMSVIIKNLEPKVPTSDLGGNKGPQFIIFAPQFRQESSYDLITVSE